MAKGEGLIDRTLDYVYDHSSTIRQLVSIPLVFGGAIAGTYGLVEERYLLGAIGFLHATGGLAFQAEAVINNYFMIRRERVNRNLSLENIS
jgi:hypothetical protein